MEKAKAAGAPAQQLETQRVDMAKFQEMYNNPFNAAITFVEPFPVGLVITLVCAGVLARPRQRAEVSWTNLA